MSRSMILKTSGYNQLAEAVDGYCLYNKNDTYIGKAIEKYGEYSALEMTFLKQLCGFGDLIVEIGANIGTHTVALAKQVGQQGKVLAFEPQRLVFQTLCANIALNSLKNVDCHWAAMGAENSMVTVPEPDPCTQNNFGGVSLLNVQQGQQIRCHTLDSLLSLPQVKLIKIDVEGMEAEVLQGGKQLIQKFKPLLYIENDRIEKSAELMQLINSLGYRMYWHRPPLFNPENYYAETENIYSGIVSVNMLCVHKEHKIKIESMEEIMDYSYHPMRK